MYNFMMQRIWLVFILLFCGVLTPIRPVADAPAALVYYVSSTTGSDANPGTQAQPFQSIARINQLQSSLKPGYQILFRCGNTWRGELLMLTQSGSAGNPIIYSSDPPGCPNPPVLSGTQPISSWSAWAGNIYIADLASGAYSVRFPPDGINQLFRDSQRLRLGRWPNLDAPDGGYATLEAQPDGTHLNEY